MFSPQGPRVCVEVCTVVLNEFRNRSDHSQAWRLRAFMHRSGLEVHCVLNNHLSLMLLENGSIHDAQRVFDAFLYQENYASDVQTVVNLLKICAKLKNLERILALHAEVLRIGFLERDASVGTMVVDMYAKHGLLGKAEEVFSKLPVRDVISWNALISGYAQHGQGEEALMLYKQMLLESVSPDVVTYVSCLKACSRMRAMDIGCVIHSEIERRGLLGENLILCTVLVAMYIDCGFLEQAHETFKKLLKRDVVLWTTLIAGFSDHSQYEEALTCFKKMQSEGISPDDVTFMCSLKACGSIGDVRKGLEIHADIERKGVLERNLDLGNTLVDMYGKCGLFVTAEHVFEKLSAKNVVGWNALLAGYIDHGHEEEALNCFKRMQSAGACPTPITYVSCLRACGSSSNVLKGKEIHLQIGKNGLLGKDVVVGTALVDMYTKCGRLAEAQHVFDELPERNVFSWNSLIAGYADLGNNEKALTCLYKMQLDSVSPNVVTFVWSLKACGCLGAIDKGEEIHAVIKKRGKLEADLVIGTALIDMYVKCCCLVKAQQTFDKILVRNVVAWTSLIAGYAEQGHDEEALQLFEQMHLEGVLPNVVTYLCSLKACIRLGASDEAKRIIDDISRKGLSKKDVFIGNALIDTFAKWGSLGKAQDIFDQLSARDVVSWNVLMAGTAEHGQGEDVFECFERMLLEGVSPDDVTFLCSLKACGNMGAMARGEELFSEIERRGLIHKDALVGGALVNMYAKCGFLERAQEVLAKLPVQNVVTWNALIAGFSQVGESKSVFLSYERMLSDGLKPDSVTFVIVLAACNRTGMIEKGETLFEVMSKDYGVVPILEHHSCMVDLLGRAGWVDKAVALIEEMPISPNVVVWHTVMGACRTWGNVELGRRAFEEAVCLDDRDGAAYALMSDIYARAPN